MKRYAALFAFALFLLMPASVLAADCEFVLGFKTIRDLIGHDIVGECGGNERYNAIGDSVQNTTGGLLVWRKSDNWTAFTDGHRTWINGPNGLVQRHINERFEWEFDYAPGGLHIVNCRTDNVATFTQLPPRSSPRAESTVPQTSPSLIELAEASGWYRDGVIHSPRSPEGKVVSPGIRSPEGEVLKALASIDRNSPHLAEAMSRWDWLFDNEISRNEWHVVEFIALLVERLPAFVPPLIALPWIHDGVDKIEVDAVELLYREALCYDLEFAIEQASAPWVVDGLSAAEQRVIGILRETYHGSQDLIPPLAQTSWVQDGLTSDETWAIWSLMGLSSRGRQDDATVLDTLRMPFLNDSVDLIDVLVLRSLGALHHSPDRSYLRQVLAHPTLHGGIADSHRSLLSVIGWVISSDPNFHQPELLDVLMDNWQDLVEERVIWLPRGGKTTLAVIHTRPGRFNTMDYLENAVRDHEEFMLEAFPDRFVVVFFLDFNLQGGGNAGLGRIFIDPGSENNVGTIAHEVAHNYWSESSAWVNEGGAELLRMASQHVPIEAEHVHLSLCQTAENLSDIDRIESASHGYPVIGHGYATVHCPYVMGQGLFVDLYNSLGDLTFRNGFRRLFLAPKSHRGGPCEFWERARCQVWKAFVTDADTTEAAAIAESIINRWYYGSPKGAQ